MPEEAVEDFVFFWVAVGCALQFQLGAEVVGLGRVSLEDDDLHDVLALKLFVSEDGYELDMYFLFLLQIYFGLYPLDELFDEQLELIPVFPLQE